MITAEEIAVWAREHLRVYPQFRIYVNGHRSPVRLNLESAEEAKRYLEETWGYDVEIEPIQ